MRLRYGSVFPTEHLSLPMEAVPLSVPRCAVAGRTTRLPLSPHCNPCFASREQPRCFPPQSVRFFSLFLQTGFQGAIAIRTPARVAAALIPHPPASRKAGYDCTQRYGAVWRDAPHCRFKSASYMNRNYRNGSTSMHKNRSPRKQGRGIHAIGNRPESASVKSTLPPSIHPRLGVSSKHQKFHRCALWRLFRSSLGNGRSD